MTETWLGFTNRDKIILRELSANSRVSLTHLSKTVGCSVATANKLLNRLVDRLDIRFTLEMELDKLGLEERHMIYVKFGRKPNEAFLIKLFKDDQFAHDVYITKGDFGLLIFAAADTPRNYIRWETDLAVNLSDYLPELRPSEFIFDLLGYMPLNSSFVNYIKEGIKIDRKDRLILQMLNENSRLSYRALSKELGIGEDTVRYRVFRLMRKGVIRRFTVAVQNADGVVGTYFVRYSFDKQTVSRIFPEQRMHSMGEDEALPLINRTPMVALLSGSYRFFGMSFGKTRNESLSAGIKWHLNLLKNNRPHEAHAIIVKPIKGLMPLRSLDAKRYYRLIWT
ncbi:MAG: AsnC family transcriptional regulator [Candidatus Marsarchaeota archaeon]|jgi:DNA-binding Lrp family transcriptional regulator|nr:AsnC family transcriptional regulator [Candidatus Marsarchaeota archaeon]MCL5111813.1 AsnC family transcriptional regulator [Candidatus Marsarchaeota archaeon]